MVSVFVSAVLPLFAVPLQPETRQPLAGAAVRVIAWSATYFPAAQPEELSGAAVGLLPSPV